jgi:hypothetical protein
VDVCGCGDGGEEGVGEREREGVAHCVDEDVGDEEGEGVIGEDQGAEGLAQEGEVWPCAAEDVAAGGEVEEVDGWGVEADVEAVLGGLG